MKAGNPSVQSQMSELENFLSGQRADGGLDSVGEFTIALEKARKKLEKYQLADPSFYLLKIFQAAIRAGAKEVQIKLTRREVYLWFETEDRAFPLQDTLTGLDNSLEVPESALRHLVLGVNATLVLEPIRVSWSEWSPEQNSGFHIENGELQVGELPQSPIKKFPAEGRSGYVFHVLKKAPSSMFKSASAEEHVAVSQRCGFAPAKVVLDGRELSQRWQTQQVHPWHEALSKPFYLAERTVLEKSGSVEMPPIPYKKYDRKPGLWIRKGGSRHSFCHQFVDVHGLSQEVQPKQKLSCRGAYAIPIALSGSNTVTFVKDGVLLESVEVPTADVGFPALGAVAIVDGSDLSVDISEFKVLQDQVFSDTLSRCKYEWTSLRQVCKENLHRLSRDKTAAEVNQAAQDSQGESVGCACLGCLGLPAILAGIFASLPFATPEIVMLLSPFVGLIGGLVTPRVVAQNKPTFDAALQQGARDRLG